MKSLSHGMNTVNVHYNHLLAKVEILSWVCMHVVIRVDEKSHYDSTGYSALLAEQSPVSFK